jgi:MFS family permease
MGIGAAAIMPTTLSVITTSFPEADRPKAIGVWVGVAGGGAVLGLSAADPAASSSRGARSSVSTWSWPRLALVGTLLVVPSSVDEDPPGSTSSGALSLVAVGGIVFGIIEGPERAGTTS